MKLEISETIMKRKLFTILVIVLLLSLTVTIFAGCDKIFSKNETRDANQVVAKISYKNQVSTITKAQLSSSFNAYAYSYVNYYSMTYEQAASYILSSLAQRELLVLYVKDRIADIEALGDPANLELRKFISNLEYVDAVDAVNKDMQSSLESVIKELMLEKKKQLIQVFMSMQRLQMQIKTMLSEYSLIQMVVLM